MLQSVPDKQLFKRQEPPHHHHAGRFLGVSEMPKSGDIALGWQSSLTLYKWEHCSS